jgi:5-formaminoimidazole-4-carboxamide-1-(beta)-D-ribofuranosyl 5'-monophosphate synthetase
MATIATLGSHSALDVCAGAKAEGFSTLVVAQKKREQTYAKYYKARKRGKREMGIVDETLVLDKFSDITNKENISYLKKKGAIFVPNRSFSVYVGNDNIEKNFPVPIFGNRFLLKAEERDAERNQYFLLEEARIDTPRRIPTPDRITKLCIVKVSEAKRSYERAFFLANSYEDYIAKSQKLIGDGIITKTGLESARIEQFVVGAQFNFNFFYSPLSGELELLGIDTRRQTNLDGLLHMTADVQLEALKQMRTSNIEIGHIASTIRESFLEDVFKAGERMVEACRHEYKPGIIGPFALQCAITEEEGKENLVVFDVSFRMPGSPGTRFTPYSSYLFRENISFGRRVAMEIKDAQKQKRIEEVTT